MNCTLDSLNAVPYYIKSLADEYTDGKVLMFGGGGYNIWRVVPRAWSHVFLSLMDVPIQHGDLPKDWVDKWKQYCPTDLPTTWDDQRLDYMEIPRTKEITEKNLKHANQVASWF